MRRIAIAAAALVVACAFPVFAQPDTTPAEVAELRLELRMESIQRVVDSMIERLSRNDPAKAEIAKARRNVSVDFVKSHMSGDSEALLKEYFKEELRTRKLAVTDLKFDMFVFRGYENGYTIRDISDRMPTERSGFTPPRSTGYPAEVAAIDNRAPHSMHDLKDYMSDRFTKAALDRIVTKGYAVEIHIGTEVEALSDLRNRGVEVLGEVKTAQGSYERLLVTRTPQGEIRYVMTGTIDGMDRVRHLSSLLRFAGPNGEGVPSNKVSIVGDVEAYKARQVEDLKAGLSRIGLEGDRAIVGFRNAMKNELFERALARRGAEHLHDVLGSNPYEGLIDRLKAEIQASSGAKRAQLGELLSQIEASDKIKTGMNRQPARVFGEVKALKDLQVAEKALVALEGKYGAHTEVLKELVGEGKLKLPGGQTHKAFAVSRGIDYGSLRAEDVRVRGANGQVETLRLVNNYYGDTMSGVVKALLETGHNRLAYFGTAGGVGEGVRVGDIHVPKEVYNWRNEAATSGVRNGFLDYFDKHSGNNLGERLKSGTALGNVFSPAVETMGWLEDVKSRGLHAIEVENSRITSEVGRFNESAPSGRKATLHTSVIISDVPGSHQTLGNSSSATTATFERMVDHYLKALDIKDIELVERESSKAADRPLARDERSARALEIADKLVPRALAKSSLLRDRIAATIGELPLETLKAIDASGKLKPSDIPGLSEEARKTLEAEVKGAYTDAELLRSLERTNSAISLAAAEVAKAHPNAEFKVRVGGGVETGRFSPNAGVVAEFVGSPELQAKFAQALAAAQAEIPGTKIRLGSAGQGAVELGKTNLLHETKALVSEFTERALVERGVHHRGSRVEYSGRQHDPKALNHELFSRFEGYNVGPDAAAGELQKLRGLVERLGGVVEMVPSSDPRLRGGQGRTLVDAEGKIRVLLPSDKPVKKFALIDELTHVHQLERMIRKLGAAEVRDLFSRAAQGDPVANARLLEWEIQAKKMVRLTRPADAPERALLQREIERLERTLDPYLDARNSNGTLNWEKVRGFANTHTQGAASFLLGLFLKDLAKVIQTGDREAINVFFDGLATTDFWSHYGLFVVGAEAGTLVYSRYLQRFVKPAFVNNVLRSNVALATGMALPELIHGKFDGRTFAINFAGLMLSSAAVKGGISAISWVKPLGALSRFSGMSRFLKLARGVPGWVYAGVETAVVLYFAEEVSSRLTSWADKIADRRAVGSNAGDLLDLVGEVRDPNDPRLQAALEASGAAYVRWRDRALQPAMDASAEFNRRVLEAGKEAGNTGAGVDRFNALAERFPNLRGGVNRVNERNDAEVDGMVKDALERFEAERLEALRVAYHENTRSGAYDPVRGASDVSSNRAQAYEDEALLYEAAAARATNPAVKAHLLEWARVTREIKTRELDLLAPSANGSRPPAADADGMTERLRGVGGGR